jgi:prophage antirepressor-like protein
MANLQTFRNESFGEIRTLNIDGEPWFVGKDVADSLGYERTDNAIRNHVDEEDKLTHQISASGQNRNMVLINESGLYSLIMSSKLPSAKQFKRWVTNEVLPAIRKHGVYATAETAERLLNDPDFMIRTFTALKEEREKNAALQSKIEQDKPKVLFADAVSTAKTSILVGELAKLLKQNGVQKTPKVTDKGQAYFVNKFLGERKEEI